MVTFIKDPPKYNGYNEKLNAGIRNEFGAVTFRLGHTLVKNSLQQLKPNFLKTKISNNLMQTRNCAYQSTNFFFFFLNNLSKYIWMIPYLSVIRQKGESQNGCYKKTKHIKFSEKRTFLTPWYTHALLPYYWRIVNSSQFFIIYLYYLN